MAARLHHVALAVSDLERARQFYGVVLGLTEIERPPFDFPGAWYDTGESHIHLIVNPNARSLRGTTEIDSRDSHFAVHLGSYDELLRRLREHDVPHRVRLHTVVEWARIFVTDPDGNVIEIVGDPS